MIEIPNTGKDDNFIVNKGWGEEKRLGTGDWGAWKSGLDLIFEAAQEWKISISGVKKPWLCWNVNNKWCVVQQRIIKEVGWTPIVGWDPNCVEGPPPLEKGSIAISFNNKLKLEALWPHFPLEFAFAWTDKIAFWHADLLINIDKMRRYAIKFDKLSDGEMMAVLSKGGIKDMLKFKSHRYWELFGCTTKKASLDQFNKGCGWWRKFSEHPNCPTIKEREKRKKYYYDSGVGIMYWKKVYHGKIYDIDLKDIVEGHCSEVGAKYYKKGKTKTEEMDLNFELKSIALKLNLEKYV